MPRDAPIVKAWVVRRPGPIDDRPMVLVDRPLPAPGAGELRVRVTVCGVCRTDLHLAEGDLAPTLPTSCRDMRSSAVVDAVGPGVRRFVVGDRVGIAWLRHTCGTCRFCVRGDENLCLAPAFTGWDADGGYAEFAVVDERYAYRLPAGFTDDEVAPLLCAGIIGFRALRRAALPAGGRLGIYGFGASAHLAAQVALAEGATVYVMTRSRRGSPVGAAARRGVGRRHLGPAAGATRRGGRSSPQRGPSCRPPWPPSTGGARWRSPASTSATSPRCATRTTCSRNVSCAV